MVVVTVAINANEVGGGVGVVVPMGSLWPPVHRSHLNCVTSVVCRDDYDAE